MTLEDLTIFDYVILSIISISIVFAFIKGFIKSIISLIGWGITLCMMYFLNPYIKTLTEKFISNKLAIVAVSIIANLLIAILISAIFTGRLNEFTSKIRGGLIDRLLGIFFGFFRGCLISCIIVTMISLCWQVFVHKDETGDIVAPKWLKEAQTYHIINKANKIINSYLPNNIKKEMEKIGNYKQLNDMVSREQIINQILTSLPKEVMSSLSSEYIKKLKDQNTSLDEQNKILELILKLNQNTSSNSEDNELIKQLLSNKYNSNNKKYDKNQNDQIEHLIESIH